MIPTIKYISIVLVSVICSVATTIFLLESSIISLSQEEVGSDQTNNNEVEVTNADEVSENNPLPKEEVADRGDPPEVIVKAVDRINELDDEVKALEREAMQYENDEDVPAELQARIDKLNAEIERIFEEDIEANSD